jgi:hypothetical protein
MFYLQNVLELTGSRLVEISEQTYWLCWQSLVPAEHRYNWQSNLAELTDQEWETAQLLVETALSELRRGIMELQFIAHLSGVQSVSGYDELFELDAVEYNVDDQFDVISHKWIVPQDGLYRVGAWVQFWELSGGDNWVRVRTKVNGVFHLNSGNFNYSDDVYPHAFLDDMPAAFDAGDEVEFFITQSDIGTSRNTASYNRTCRAWAYKVGS